MKMLVEVDVTDKDIPIVDGKHIIPTYAEVQLDYGDKVLYLYGKTELCEDQHKYEKLRIYENSIEDKEILMKDILPQKKQVRIISTSDTGIHQEGYQKGWNACIDEILNRID